MTALSRTPALNNTEKLAFAQQYLDEHCPLHSGSHSQVAHYVVYYNHLMAFMLDGTQTGLKSSEQFVALCGHRENPTAILLQKSDGLHIEIISNTNSNTIVDIQFETALTSVNNTQQQGKDKSLWISFVSGVQYGLLKHMSKKQFTAKNGDNYVFAHS